MPLFYRENLNISCFKRILKPEIFRFAENQYVEILKVMKKGKVLLMVLAVVAVGGAFVWAMRYGFEHSELIRSAFSGASNEVVGEAGADSAATLAERGRITALVSMYIFAVITVLQFASLMTAIAVMAGIRSGDDTPELKLKQLENAELFFDIPLYVGLFGTVSAFLVMTFSPQSSRLIAYSSTLIGIIFSLVLRLTLQYPTKRRLLREIAVGWDVGGDK